MNTNTIQESLLALEGDSLLVVGDSNLVKVHIHTNKPWKVMERCSTFGDLSSVSVGNMVLQNQAAGARDHASHSDGPEHAVTVESGSAPIAVVAVVQGEGFRSILKDLGVLLFVEGGQSMNPSTQEMLEAVEAVDSPHVILLPNNRNVMLAAEQVTRLATKRVDVLPSSSIPHAIASMMAFSLERPAEQMLDDMRGALESVSVGEITQAVRDARMNGWDITEGQTIALTDGGIVGVSDSVEGAVRSLVESMCTDESEIVTLYFGADVTEADAQALADDLGQRFENLEVEVYSGGQPIYQYLVTVE